MLTLIKHVPGLIGAVVAFLAARLLAWLGMGSFVGEFLVFLACYLLATLAAERAMIAYGRERGP